MTGSAPIRTLIVDDEPVARAVLRDELREARDIEIVGEAEDGVAAVARIAELRPDLVFLDLKMPGMGGFEVIRALPSGVLPVIVIVTAYDEHAIRAFEAGALDYLLKPVSQERLHKALERVRSLRGAARKWPNRWSAWRRLGERAAGRSRKVVGRAGEEYHLLDLDDVLAFQAERELVWIVTARQRYLATQTLQAIGRG